MSIREVRKEKGMTQLQLAEALGVNYSIISKYESGKVIPPSDKLARIAEILNTSVENLIDQNNALRRRTCISIVDDRGIEEKPESPTDWKKRMRYHARQYVLARAQECCELCGEEANREENGQLDLQVHFIRRYADGGLPTPDNMVALCSRCFFKVSLEPNEEDTQKLMEATKKIPF